jgi:hypothetical protein
MRNTNTFGDKLANWKLIAGSVSPRLTEMPHLQPIHTDLQALIAEAEALELEQETIRGRLRELSKQRTTITRRGQALRARVAAHLKGSLGFTSNELIQHGLNPLKTEGRARPVRKKNAEPAGAPAEPPAEAPVPTPTTTTTRR